MLRTLLKNVLFLFGVFLSVAGLAASLFLSSASQAHATTVQTQTSYNGGLYYYWDRWKYLQSGNNGGAFTGWALGLQNPTASVNYTVRAYRADTGAEIFTGDTIPVGTSVTFTRTLNPSDVQWFASGYSEDSPYGTLYNWSGDPSGNGNYFFGPYYGEDPFSDPYDGGTPPISGYYFPSQAGNPWIDRSHSSPPGQYELYAPTCTAGDAAHTGTETVSYPGGQATLDSYAILNVADPSGDSYNYSLTLPTFFGISTSTLAGTANGGNTPLVTTFNTAGNGRYGTAQNPFYGGLASISRTSDGLSETVLPITAAYYPATITYTIPFGTAYGSMWYEYYDSRNLPGDGAGCYGSDKPMAALPNMDASGYQAMGYFGGSTYLQGWGAAPITNVGDISGFNEGNGVASTSAATDTQALGLDYQPAEAPEGFGGNDPTWGYTFAFPPVNINFTFNYGTTTGPSTPTLSGPTTGQTNTPYTYTGSNCVDPDNTNVVYGFDWNNDKQVDTWSPVGIYQWGFPNGEPWPLGSNYYGSFEGLASSTFVGPAWNSNWINYVPYGTTTPGSNYALTWGVSVASGSSSSATYLWTTPGTYTVAMQCQNVYRATSQWAQPLTVHITPAPPSVTMSFDNSASTTQSYSIGSGTPHVDWSSLNTTSCSPTGSWSNDFYGQSVIQTSGTDNTTISTPGTYNYTVACAGLGGTATTSIQVNAIAGPPVLNLAVDGNTGTSTNYQSQGDTISWNVYNADSCTAQSIPSTGGWSGSKSAVPPHSTYDYHSDYVNNYSSPLPLGTYTYVMTCGGAYGTTTKSVGLNIVYLPPQVNYCSSNPSSATPGSPITWSAYITGGTPPYSYLWNSSDYDTNWNQVTGDSNPSLDGNTNSTPTVSYSSSGYKGATLSITDANGVPGSYPANCYSASIAPTLNLSINGPTVGSVGGNYTFNATAVSSDPNDQITYYFYWPDTGAYDYLPSTTDDYGDIFQDYITQGLSQPDSHSWTDTGDQTFYVYACDESNLCTNWTPYTITINDNPIVPDVCSADANPAATGFPVTWSVSTSSSSPTFSWSGTDGLSSTLYQATKSYSSVGTKSASVVVTSGGISHTVDCSDINVNAGLPKIDLSEAAGSSAYTYGSVVVSKATPVHVKLGVSNALSCSATGDTLWAPHINGLTDDQITALSSTPDISNLSSPLPNSETLKVTCTNANGQASATLRVGVLSVLEF